MGATPSLVVYVRWTCVRRRRDCAADVRGRVEGQPPGGRGTIPRFARPGGNGDAGNCLRRVGSAGRTTNAAVAERVLDRLEPRVSPAPVFGNVTRTRDSVSSSRGS